MREKDNKAVANDTAATVIALFVILLLINSPLTSSVKINNNYSIWSQKAYAQGNNWYLGKGAKEGTYFIYTIQDHDTKQGQPFTMTVYFKEFDSSKKYWIAPVYVVEPNGNVLNGTFHLSDLDLSALGTSQIPLSMKPYRGAYVNTLDWLASFVPKPGLSLIAPYWGKLAAIGGSPISPSGSAKTTTPAGTFDTTVVSWHYGADNYIYVAPNLPYPVKAKAFAAVTTGNPPIQFAFELQSMGQGPPQIPKSQIHPPKPPMTLQTGRGTYYIQLFWEPTTIVHGKDTKFGVLFKDSSKQIVNRVVYSFKVTTSDGKVIQDKQNQRAEDGTGFQMVNIPTAGQITVKVSIDVVAGRPSGEFIESATFNLVAT